MPKKKNAESQPEQSERFRAEVERLIAAGELNPIDADAALDSLVVQSRITTDDIRGNKRLKINYN